MHLLNNNNYTSNKNYYLGRYWFDKRLISTDGSIDFNVPEQPKTTNTKKTIYEKKDWFTYQ